MTEYLRAPAMPGTKVRFERGPEGPDKVYEVFLDAKAGPCVTVVLPVEVQAELNAVLDPTRTFYEGVIPVDPEQ
jgi:hypothetical protein